MNIDIKKKSGIPPGFGRRTWLKRVAFFFIGFSLIPKSMLSNELLSTDSTHLNQQDYDTFTSFVDIVIPGAKKYSEFLAIEMAKEFYGFKKYLRSLIKSLEEMALTNHSSSFSALTEDLKQKIIDEGTKKGLWKKQIFNGAIYLLQLIVFAGLCEEDQSCIMINFPGTSRGKFKTYPNFHRLNVQSLTVDGNPA